jgi:excisionase family DNA binding protein
MTGQNPAFMAGKHKQPTVGAANLPTILTKQEAADLLRCTVRYLERQIRAGRLRALKPTGKLVRIYRRDLDAFLETGSTIGVAE